MRRRLSRCMLAWWMLISATAGAADMLENATQAYRQLRYGQAIELIDQAIASASLDPGQRVKAMQMKALSLAASGAAKRSTAVFRRILAIWPDFQLPAGVSPKLKPPFDRARQLSARQPALRLQHVPPPAPDRWARLELQLRLEANPFHMVRSIRLRLTTTRGASRQWIAPVNGSKPVAFQLPEDLDAERLTYRFEALDEHGGVLMICGSPDPFSIQKKAPPVPPVVARQEPTPEIAAGALANSVAVEPGTSGAPGTSVESDTSGETTGFEEWWVWAAAGVLVAAIATGVALASSTGDGDRIRYEIELR